MVDLKSLRAYWIMTIEVYALIDYTLRPAIQAYFFEASFRATNLLCPQSHAASLNLKLSSPVARPDAYGGVSVAVHPGSVFYLLLWYVPLSPLPPTATVRFCIFGAARKSDR
jgi:hypothetical protein